MENFDAVYAGHFQAVYRFLLGLCRSAPLAEELCQEAFVRAMIHWRDFHGDCAPWKPGCAPLPSGCISAAAAGMPTPCPRIAGTRSPAPRKLLLSREEAQLHRLCIRSPNPTEIFTLRVFAELDFRQLGELFHKSDTWARVTFYRAKVKLQEAFRRDEYEQV